jgi:2-haloacid dehalogenase
MIRAIVFDAYGTLLDVHAAMAAHAAKVGPDWQRLSQEWRLKQLEYTWVRSLAGPDLHRDFFTITREALHFVAARFGITDQALLADLLTTYRELPAYPEVPEMLARIQAMGIGRTVLSNGEPGMLGEAMRAAKIDHLLDHVLSIERVGVYKPDPRVYRLATERLGLAASEMAFVSSNAWDAFGAREFGFVVHWVNRTGQPDEYGLRHSVRELSDLAALPDLLAR